MSINKIGPKEIYNYAETDEQIAEINQFLREDTPLSVEKFKKFYESGGVKTCHDGGVTEGNILIMAAGLHNIHLLKYITEHVDPNILNLRDHRGLTALWYAVQKGGTIEKVIASVQILIQAGANINERLIQPGLNFLLHEENEENYYGSDYLGQLISNLSRPSLEPANKERMELLTQLFIANGVTKAYARTNESTYEEFSAEDGTNEQDTSQRAQYGRILKDMTDKANLGDWRKTRLLFLGQGDKNSTLSDLPAELVNLIFQKSVQLTFEKQ